MSNRHIKLWENFVEEETDLDLSKEEVEAIEHELDELLNKKIILYNDNVNTFEHVIECLIKYCKHTSEQAEQCTTIIHYKGKCAVKSGGRKDLEPILQALLENGLTAEIE
jgi:ATP-dependent Clp protease adaptor protein ClpS